MTRIGTVTRVGLLVAVFAAAGASDAAARSAREGQASVSPRAKAAKAPPGPATRVKVLTFVTLQTAGVLKIQWRDRKGNPTKGPTDGTLTYRTNITRPRKGSMPLSRGKWKPKEKTVVFMGIAPRQRYVCPPRSYWIRVTIKVGRKRYHAFKRTKLNCI